MFATPNAQNIEFLSISGNEKFLKLNILQDKRPHEGGRIIQTRRVEAAHESHERRYLVLPLGINISSY